MSSPAPALPAAAPADSEPLETLPLLRMGAALQALGAVPGVLIFTSFFWNEAVHHRIYERGTGNLGQAAFWFMAPLAVLLAPFVWARQAWAFRASLALAPTWALGPLVYLLSGLAKPGSETFLVYATGAGVVAAALICQLLWKGRAALQG